MPRRRVHRLLVLPAREAVHRERDGASEQGGGRDLTDAKDFFGVAGTYMFCVEITDRATTAQATETTCHTW